MDPRLIVVGDLHGCLGELHALLDKVGYRPGVDYLFQAGDILDRGPDPIGCLRFLKNEGAGVVLGNHDDKHLRWRWHEARRLATGKPNPMTPLYGARLEINQALSEEDIAWLSKLPAILRLNPRWVMVHGGLESKYAVDNQDPRSVLITRWVDAEGEMVVSKENSHNQPEGSVYWTERWKGPDSVIYGHAVHSYDSPRVDRCGENVFCLGVDTGCVFGGHLTAAVLSPNGYRFDFVQVPAAKTYAKVSVPVRA